VKRGTWLLAVLVAAAGCESIQPRTVRIDSTVGIYQTATLTYRIDAGKLSEAVKVANITGRQVSYEQKPSGPYPDRSIALLSLQYPHPLGRPGYALAEVVVEARKPPTNTVDTKKSAWRRWADDMHKLLTQNSLPGVKLANGIHEAWTLDIPRTELDGVIGQLSQTGYFHLAGNPAPGVNVSCKIDGQQINKQWGHVSALDALIDRVRHEGQLASYTRPLDEEKPKSADAQAVRFAAASWPPAGGVPGTPPWQPTNSPRGDWIANQAGQQVPQPRAPWAAPTQQGRFPQTIPQPYYATSQPGGPSAAAAAPPTASQPFPPAAARYPLGRTQPQSESRNGAAGTTPSYGPGDRMADGPGTAKY
jgi:hypothetical protein